MPFAYREWSGHSQSVDYWRCGLKIEKNKVLFFVDQQLNIALIQETTFFFVDEVVINIVA
jgi:hypothetical protein